MAVLGVQVVFSMVMFTFLHKLAPYYSIGRWMLSKRLYRYLHPTNEELRQLMSGGGAGKPTTHSGKVKRRNEQRRSAREDNKTESFTVPRNLPIQLDQAVVEDIDLLSLQYYSDYIWLVDFSFSTIFVYVLTEIYYVFAQHKIEVNISVLWCLMALAFCVRILASQAWLYMRTQEGGERVLLVTFTFFFLVFAMGVLVVGDGIIEFGLEEGYRNFSGNAISFLQKQGTDTNYGPMSFMTFKSILAFCGMLVGALFTFPGLRMAKLHLDSVKYSQGRKIVQILLQANYLLPLALIVLWIKPASRDILCGRSFVQRRTILYEDQFEGLRILLVLVMCAIRIILTPVYLQSHLNLAHERVESIKKESGRITNTELQKTVARVFYYLCVVAIQYLAPIFVIIFLTFLLKTLGGGSWVSLFGETAVNYFTNIASKSIKYSPIVAENSTMAAFLQSTSHLTSALGDVRGIFSPVWYKGLITYFLWWVITAWFSSTSLGVMYYSQSSL